MPADNGGQCVEGGVAFMRYSFSFPNGPSFCLSLVVAALDVYFPAQYRTDFDRNYQGTWGHSAWQPETANFYAKGYPRFGTVKMLFFLIMLYPLLVTVRGFSEAPEIDGPMTAGPL